MRVCCGHSVRRIVFSCAYVVVFSVVKVERVITVVYAIWQDLVVLFLFLHIELRVVIGKISSVKIASCSYFENRCHRFSQNYTIELHFDPSIVEILAQPTILNSTYFIEISLDFRSVESIFLVIL